eukprot:gene8865-18363_t
MNGYTSSLTDFPFGGRLINEGLVEVLQNVSSKAAKRYAPQYDCKVNNAVVGVSSVRRRCRDYLACEYFNPMIELHNVVIDKGVVYVIDPDKESMDVIRSFGNMFAGKDHRLPPFLASYTLQNDWILGPKVVVVDTAKLQSRPVCHHVWDTNGYFHFPWESRNAFHSLNDNLMSVLASIVIQHISTSLPLPRHRTLFLFNKDPEPTSTANLLFKLLHMVFEGDVRPAASVLTGQSVRPSVRQSDYQRSPLYLPHNMGKQ